MGRDGRGVKKASESSIQIAFTYKGVECRERIRLKPTAANLKRAEQWRASVLLAIENGTFVYAKSFPNSPNAAKFAEYKGEVQTVGEYLEAWLARKKAHLKASTWDGYRKIVNYQLIPALGKEVLADLKRQHVRDWIATLDCTNKRLANIQSVLRSALQDAVDEDELIPANPLHDWTYARQEEPKEEDEIDPFTAEEQAAIIAAMPEQMANMVQFAFWSGLRTSELVALEWRDVDFVRETVRVRRAQTQTADAPEGTKTAAGRREVKLLPPALQALIQQKAHTALANKEVFQDPRHGERWGGDMQIRLLWTRYLRKAGVRYRKPYQTRHTYASMMLSAGEHPMWVARQMGHANATITLKTYARWMPEADQEAGSKAVEKFAAMLRFPADSVQKSSENSSK